MALKLGAAVMCRHGKVNMLLASTFMVHANIGLIKAETA